MLERVCEILSAQGYSTSVTCGRSASCCHLCARVCASAEKFAQIALLLLTTYSEPKVYACNTCICLRDSRYTQQHASAADAQESTKLGVALVWYK
jgi:hypothetical protein